MLHAQPYSGKISYSRKRWQCLRSVRWLLHELARTTPFGGPPRPFARRRRRGVVGGCDEVLAVAPLPEQGPRSPLRGKVSDHALGVERQGQGATRGDGERQGHRHRGRATGAAAGTLGGAAQPFERWGRPARRLMRGGSRARRRDGCREQPVAARGASWTQIRDATQIRTARPGLGGARRGL